MALPERGSKGDYLMNLGDAFARIAAFAVLQLRENELEREVFGRVKVEDVRKQIKMYGIDISLNKTSKFLRLAREEGLVSYNPNSGYYPLEDRSGGGGPGDMSEYRPDPEIVRAREAVKNLGKVSEKTWHRPMGMGDYHPRPGTEQFDEFVERTGKVSDETLRKKIGPC